MEIYFIAPLIFVAFLYSSIGHGGASGYLGLMALFSTDPEIMRSSALVLNLFVAGIAFVAYYRGGHFRSRILIPFIITSIPFAYLGALVEIDPQLYKIILGILLFFAVLRILVIKPKERLKINAPPLIPALFIGALLGLFSGMIGIGGGIILSPLLLVLGWADLKQSAAASALFIFLNSSAGLTGISQTGINLEPVIFFWILAALGGGILGAYNGSFRYSSIRLQYILAAVLVLASFKLFFL